MSLYTFDHRSGLVNGSYERSPTIALETDAISADALPAAVRAAADSTLLGRLAAFGAGDLPRGVDGAVTWLAGDTLLVGSAASIRHNLRTPGRRCFVPVHLPCLDEMPLITIQPRWLRGGRQQDFWGFHFRIGGSPTPSQQTLEALKTNGQPWAQLSLALFAELQKSGAGIEPLVRMWENHQQLQPLLASLVLRNLVVLMVRHSQPEKAEQFLELGRKYFLGYSELLYLAALLHIRQNRAAKALPLLEHAKKRDGGFLGSGGESSYRADWLLGLLAIRVGNQRVAFGHFLPGMTAKPVFIPAVEELLNLRLPPGLVEAHQWHFCRMVRSEPQLLGKVFEYLLLHRAFDAARRLVETVPLTGAIKVQYRERLESAASPFHPRKASETSKPGIILHGPFFEHTSLGRINREIAASLVGSAQLNTCLEPSALAALPPQMFAGSEPLESALLRHPAHLDLTIRHQWPPDFRRPPRGRLAVILPWEYGTIPRVWVSQIEKNVDELWVPSRFVRDVLVRSGVKTTRVEVIPNGVDPNVFSPEGPNSRPQGSRKFVFLFVGGAIRRKGVDVLLEAYQAAFDCGEDVSLVLNVSGATDAYRHNTLTQQLQEIVNDPRSPHVQLLTGTLDDATLASLYRGCDAFVLPYRGEGFGMPLLEAMACGKPVITTSQGPSRDFCSDKTAYRVSAREQGVPEEPPPLGPLVGDFTWFEPDLGDLQRTLRHVYDHPGEAMQRGSAAARSIREDFTWSHIAQLYQNRIREIVGQDKMRSA
jgi:glycosyltransferase involved in cell wall biosynthesis